MIENPLLKQAGTPGAAPQTDQVSTQPNPAQQQQPAKPKTDMAAPGTPARDGADHDTTGVSAGDFTGGLSYNNMGGAKPNNFMSDVNRWGFGSAVKQHAPGWGQWLGANTVTGGSIPNWAVVLGLLGAGGLGAYGLKNLIWGREREKNAAFAGIAKEAMARAMQAQDPAYMGVVTSSHPDVTAGNCLARLVEAVRTHENGRFGPELPTQR